jgi:hypothetical protein
MVEGKKELSKNNLLTFLDFVAEKGLMNPKTASGYKKASNVVLQILDEKEATDLSKLNLDELFLRHRNLAARRILPTTLKSYEIRTRAAVNAFIEYSKDPSSWKSGVKVRTTKGKTEQTTEKAKTKEPIIKSKETTGEEEQQKYPTMHIDLQIHISPDAKPEQIDKIFASMREHLYPKNN